ncbi:hypothetical protein FO519_001216 [Halicephalobus sp. NKZ332]|nr:hypothetical protein FO519_001216 [Halicephalobus sp. NKZ332]
MLILVALTFLSVLNFAAADCPNETYSIPLIFGSKYNCMYISIDKRSFTYGEQVCGLMKGHLFTIPNGHVDMYISSLVEQSGIRDGVYIGVTNTFGGVWKTVDDGKNMNYTQWGPAEPKNGTDPLCAYFDTYGVWYSDYCYNEHYYICGVPDA